MNKRLLEKYFFNNCTDKELDTSLESFNDVKNDKELEQLLFEIYEDLNIDDFEPNTDFDALLHKIHHEINIRQIPEFDNIEKDSTKAVFSRLFPTKLRNAAAILLVFIIGYGLFVTGKYSGSRINVNKAEETFNEVSSSPDAISKVTLPDGSLVWLNHSSILKYPAVFKGSAREVELNGEGYFEVASNRDIPFIVNVKQIKITAYGTSFNLMAYADEDRVETSLIDGSVEIFKQLSNGELAHLYKMNQHDHVVYLENEDKIQVRTIKDDRYLSWKDGKLIFTEAPFEEVVQKLSRWFNVDIEIEDNRLNGMTLTATFVNETLPQVMELLAYALPIDYSITKREGYQDGTFSKRQVFLYYRDTR